MLNLILMFFFYFAVTVFMFRNPIFMIIAIIALIFYPKWKINSNTARNRTTKTHYQSNSTQYKTDTSVIDVEYTQRELKD